MSTSVPIEYRAARVDPEGRIPYFEEKLVLNEYSISMGIDVIEKQVLAYCKPQTDIAQHVIPILRREQKAVFAYTYREATL